MASLRGTGGATSANNPASITLVNSTTPLTGDLILCFIEQNPGSAGNYDVITPPSGFAAVTSASVQKADWSKLIAYSKIAGGSETNSYQFSFGATPDGAAGNILVYSSVDGANPTPTVATQDDTGSNTAYLIPSITTQFNNSAVVAAIAGGGNTGFSTATFASAWTNSYVEFLDTCLNTEWASCATATQTKATAGAVGTAQATSSSSDTSLAIVIEIKDGGGAATAVVGALKAPFLRLKGPYKGLRATRSFVSETQVVLTGSLVNFNTGTLTPAPAITLTGSLANFAAGTLTPATDVPLVGALITFSAGIISAGSGDVTVALTGSAIAFSAGTLTPSLAVALAGAVENYLAGQLIPALSLALSGAAQVYSAGNLTPDLAVTPAGQSFTFQPGTVTTTGGDPATPSNLGDYTIRWRLRRV